VKRKAINILRKSVHQVGSIYKITRLLPQFGQYVVVISLQLLSSRLKLKDVLFSVAEHRVKVPSSYQLVM
jgi:hypothetical protein